MQSQDQPTSTRLSNRLKLELRWRAPGGLQGNVNIGFDDHLPKWNYRVLPKPNDIGKFMCNKSLPGYMEFNR